ncbi:MAG TPA: DUF72 domain-containing protein [Actinospica sp.]|jgi:uncharacterized protein YecE (DUF72 family)|nr:DUF72 domain-containing protein [Actinospica sp.]
MELHVGCAMWTHAAWQGRHLPGHRPLPSRERLRAYAGLCNAVEGNTTFYATPSRETVATWAEQTPADFRFVLKLPRTVTHEGRLGDVDAPLRSFLTAIEPLGPRAHALWVQLPPSFGPGGLDALAGFLRRLRKNYGVRERIAVEVRHRAFFEDERWRERLERLLAADGADSVGEDSVGAGGVDEAGGAGGVDGAGGAGGRCGAEWVDLDTTVLYATEPTTADEREAWAKKPRLPRRMRALTDHPIVRYIARDDVELTVEGWQPWIETVAGWLREGRSPTFFLHTPDNVEAPALARRFHAAVRAVVPELAPLPEPAAAPATQETLF